MKRKKQDNVVQEETPKLDSSDNVKLSKSKSSSIKEGTPKFNNSLVSENVPRPAGTAVHTTPKSLDTIYIKGARVHNLKNVDVHIPRNKFIVVTGVSGSGKSSLTIDTLYAEGQRRYAESLSAYARQFLTRMNKPDVDYIKGLCPAIAIEQKVITRTPRSTVGSMTEIYDYLRLFFARLGKTISPISGRQVKKDDVADVLKAITELLKGIKCT
jgi:excinuclease ABC subunit A